MAASPPPAEPVVVALRAEAVRLGFSRMGIAAAGVPPHHEAFRDWLGRGLAGPTGTWLTPHEPLRRSPSAVLEGARSIVMLATDHATAVPAAGRGRGRVARYAWGDDYHDILRERLNTLATWLESQLPGCRAHGVVDSAPLAERDFAWLAGLGWFGKNTMLIDPDAGSYFLLSALLTDADLPANSPLQFDHCGTCTACLDACPTGALPEPRILDASRCISSLTIETRGPIPSHLREGLGDWVFGCDVCQEVCPWNRHAPGTTDPAFQPRAGAATLPLADLLRLDEAGFRRRFRDSPLLRAKRRGLLRSAAIALGNRPDPAAFEALVAALGDAEPVVRGAAAWALGRWRAWTDANLASRAAAALRDRAPVECDDSVRAEISAAIAGPARGP